MHHADHIVSNVPWTSIITEMEQQTFLFNAHQIMGLYTIGVTNYMTSEILQYCDR